MLYSQSLMCTVYTNTVRNSLQSSRRSTDPHSVCVCARACVRERVHSCMQMCLWRQEISIKYATLLLKLIFIYARVYRCEMYAGNWIWESYLQLEAY